MTNAQVMDGSALAEKIRAEVAAGAAELDRAPGLAAVLVGEDPASQVYVAAKGRAAEEAGFVSESLRLPADATEGAVLEAVAGLNGRDDIDGILVQLPLPDQVDVERVVAAVDPDKDADGFHPVNIGRLARGLPAPVSCTPAGVMRLLDEEEVGLEGARAVVLGRSLIVGKPMAQLLMGRHATVTVCHSRTRGLPDVCSEADVIVAAVGVPALVTDAFVQEGAVVVDVGIHRLEDEERVAEIFGRSGPKWDAFQRRGAVLVGDCHPSVADKASKLSPVPGGVGPLTIAMLLSNTLDLARVHQA